MIPEKHSLRSETMDKSVPFCDILWAFLSLLKSLSHVPDQSSLLGEEDRHKEKIKDDFLG